MQLLVSTLEISGNDTESETEPMDTDDDLPHVTEADARLIVAGSLEAAVRLVADRDVAAYAATTGLLMQGRWESLEAFNALYHGLMGPFVRFAELHPDEAKFYAQVCRDRANTLAAGEDW